MAGVRFILIVLGICVAGYSSLLLFGGTSTYCALTKGKADLTPCYKYFVKNQKAEILLVGDSSLLYGVEPDVVEKVSHRSVYNYGIVGPVFAFDPEQVIDHYLARNERPKAIVVYISPWDQVEPGAIHDEIWFPAGLAALQHGTAKEVFAVLRARPSALVELPPIILRSIGFSRTPNVVLREAMEAAGGHFDYPATLTDVNRAIGRCPYSDSDARVPDTARTRSTLAALKARMAARGIPLYVYAAPFARCGANVAAIEQAYRGVSDNAPTPLPDALFSSDARPFVHVNEDGAKAVSTLLGEFVVAKGIGRPQ